MTLLSYSKSSETQSLPGGGLFQKQKGKKVVKLLFRKQFSPVTGLAVTLWWTHALF